MLRNSVFPNGFPGGVTIRNLPILNTYGGNVFWVDSGSGSNGHKGTERRPFATVDYAVGRCTANNGDIVMVKAGHTETYSAAAKWVLDVAGVHFHGLGTGSDSPKIIMDTIISVDIDITADNCGIHNFQFEAAFADITKLLHVTAKNFVVDGCEFREQVATENWITLIDCDGTTNNECDGLTFINNVVIGADVKNEHVIKIAADITGLKFNDNFVELGVLNDKAMINVLTGKDLRSCEIAGNRFYRQNTQGELLLNVDTGTANTGFVAHNFFFSLDTTAAVLIETTTLIGQFENYMAAATDESGLLDPVAGVDT